MIARLLLALALLGAALPAAAQAPGRGWPAAADVAIRVIGIPSVVVTGWDRDSVDALAALPTGAGTLVASGSAAARKFAVEDVADSSALAGARLELRVPRGARLWLRGVRLEADLAALTGTVDIAAGRGRVRVEGGVREALVTLVDGGIEVVGPAARAVLRTGGGTIVVRGLAGELDARTVSGPILAGGVRLDRARLESVTGEIAVKGRVRPGGILAALTHAGDVELRLPASVDAELAVSAPAARIVSEFGPLRGGRRTLGAGGAEITVTTLKGAVRLLRHEEADVNPGDPGGISGTR